MLYTMPNGTQFRDPQPVVGLKIPGQFDEPAVPQTRSFEMLCTEVISTEVKNWFHTFKMYGHYHGNHNIWMLKIEHIDGEPTGIDYSMDAGGQLIANSPMFPHFSGAGIFAFGWNNA